MGRFMRGNIRMIEAGAPTQVHWGDGNWVILDIGFSARSATCGLAIGEEEPRLVRFNEAKDQIRSLVEKKSPLNLIVEAPLSVCFSTVGNPKGRSIERDGCRTRYWYCGLGCAVMVASMYLIRDIWKASQTIRLFEGFVSYKDGSVPSDHRRDVALLRCVVRDPTGWGRIVGPEQLKEDPSDELLSAFYLIPSEARLHFGVDAGFLIIRDYPLEYYMERLDFMCRRHDGQPRGIVEISLRGEVAGDAL
jgi:hypothetical protein